MTKMSKKSKKDITDEDVEDIDMTPYDIVIKGLDRQGREVRKEIRLRNVSITLNGHCRIW